MRKLITTTFVSLDGVSQAPGGPEEDTSNGFAHGGWTVPFWSDEIGAFMEEAMGKPFDMVLGRKTYEIFAGFWPNQDSPDAKPLNDARKYVASRGSVSLDWANSQQLDGDVNDAVRVLKQQDGPELQVHGSCELIQTLLQGNVIDEMRIITYPVVLGSGKRLFESSAPALTMKPLKVDTLDNGVILSVYEPRPNIATGSFG